MGDSSLVDGNSHQGIEIMADLHQVNIWSNC